MAGLARERRRVGAVDARAVARGQGLEIAAIELDGVVAEALVVGDEVVDRPVRPDDGIGLSIELRRAGERKRVSRPLDGGVQVEIAPGVDRQHRKAEDHGQGDRDHRQDAAATVLAKGAPEPEKARQAVRSKAHGADLGGIYDRGRVVAAVCVSARVGPACRGTLYSCRFIPRLTPTIVLRGASSAAGADV
jgi:hypothetical protein